MSEGCEGQAEDFDWRVDPLQPIVTVALDLHTFGQANERSAAVGTEQGLPAAGQGHDPGGEGLAQPLDLDGLRAAGDVVGAIGTQADRADVDAHARLETEVEQRAVVRQRIACCVRNVVEQTEETVGAIDLPTVMVREQVARPSISARSKTAHRVCHRDAQSIACCQPSR